MHRRFRQLFTSLKEHTSVSYAKVATMGGFCDVDLIVVKATAPDDLPMPERYISELLKIFSLSPSSFRAFSHSFARRFAKTRSWRVALKCLLLLHRLLRSVPENTPFRSELMWTRSNGSLSLHPCHFRDDSSSTGAEDYTLFIKSYAQLLNEALDCFSIDFKPTYDEELPESLSDKMKEVGEMLEVLPQLQSLMDRVICCRPAEMAARNMTVQAAMKHIIRDSFTCYTTFRREIVLVLENLFQMPYKNCITAFGIYKKAAVQATQLCEFYDWCKNVRLCGSYEYPFIDRIPHIQIQALDTFLNGMWQLTESSASPTPSLPSSWTLTEDEGDRQLVVRKDEVIISTKWERFEDDLWPKKETEERPLIQLDDSENESWEDLLEASVNLSRGNSKADDEFNDWKIQLYNPNPNPFLYGSYTGSGSDPLYPWGL